MKSSFNPYSKICGWRIATARDAVDCLDTADEIEKLAHLRIMYDEELQQNKSNFSRV